MDQFKKIALLLATIGLAIGLLLFANYSVRNSAIDQLQVEVHDRTQRLLGHVEYTLGQSLEALITIANSGASSCSLQQLKLMRRTVYEVDVIKELGVSGGDGSGICNHIGDDLRVRPVSEPEQSANRNVLLQVVEVRGSGKAAIMVTWVVNASEHYVAIVPTSALLSGATAMDSGDTGEILSMKAGTLITSNNWDENFAEGEFLTAATISDRYPVSVQSRAATVTAFGQIIKTMMFVNIGGSVIVLLLAFLAFRLSRLPEQPLTEIERGIKRDEFIPYYQPVIDIRTGKLMGCEVLTRWLKQDGSIVPPGAFIALAEASGLAIPMTRSVMRRVADDLSDTDVHSNELKIGINLFDAHFENNDIVEDIQEIFGSSEVEFSQLMFEVTERQPLSNIARAQIVVKKIQSCGAKVALDDAGTGHGGLAYLQQFGMDAIKIDKMFVDNIKAETKSAPIVDSMINMANDLGMEVIAEGIETAVQMEYLRVRGVRAVQGYLFAPPLPKKAYLELCMRLKNEIASGDDVMVA